MGIFPDRCQGQGHQEVSSHQILCDKHRHAKDNDQPCSIILVRFGKRCLCDNKAPQIKRQVASIDKKSDFRAKSGPFRTSTSCLRSSSQKKQTASKTVTSAKVPAPSPNNAEFQGCPIPWRRKAQWTEIWQRCGHQWVRSSTPKKSHQQQLERSHTHQKLVTQSHQDQIRTLRIV